MVGEGEEKGYGGLRWFLFILVLAAAAVFFSVNVQAAKAERFSVTVNSEYKGIMEKKGKDWYLKSDGLQGEKGSLEGIQYIKTPKGKAISSSYYYFYKNGRLDTRKVFHTLSTRVNNKNFYGDYYFGYENGRLYMKRGWVTVGKKKYWLSSSGRKYTNCWKGGCYLNGKGEIVRNTKTPDGYYVDCDGHKCNKNEVKLSSLKKKLSSLIKGYGGSWSVYVKNLKTNDVLSINEKSMYPASVIKLFVMASTYDSIKKGTIKKTASVDRLLKEMITVSDNEAYNALVRKHDKSGSFVRGAGRVNQYLKKNGYKKTGCHSTLHPSSSYFSSDGKSNQASARDAGVLLERIYRGKCVSGKYSKEMLSLLLKQTRRWKIPAGLPSGTKVANKTGETSQYQHDAAIVYGPKTDYVVCIFSQAGESSGTRGIKSLSSEIYKALNK